MNKHFIINIGRQLGSGGLLIGKSLAKDLNIKFYDKELLDLAATESGFDKKFFEKNDEQQGLMKMIFNSFDNVFSNSPYTNQLSDESLFKIQSDVIRKAAEQDSCVFVGRCADYILRDMTECVNIFITANKEDRIERISKLHNVDSETAIKMIKSGDEQRASYYNYYSTKKWGAASSYHLCINSSLLGLEGTVEFIKSFILKRFDL